MQPQSHSNDPVSGLIRRIGSWRKVLFISTSLSIAFSLLSGLTALSFLNSITAFIERTNSSLPYSEEYWTALVNSETSYGVASLFSLPALLAGIVSLIGWTHSNARLAFLLNEQNLSFGTGWAIGSWFVPILNLFRPREILKESLTAVSNSRFTPILNTWWVLFVINTIADNILFRLQGNIDSAFEALGDNATWPQYEEALLDQKVLLALEVFSYWGLALIPSVLLLILLGKTKPEIGQQDAEPAPETA